jgi:predicted PurR-regulated permease PerM
MFYFFRDADSIMQWLRDLLPFPERQREEMIAQVHDLVFVTVASTLSAAGLTGVIGGVAFLVVGIHNVVFWGVVMAFTSLVPFVGAWLIWGPTAAWLLAQGHVGKMIALVAICGVAVLIIDNVLRPLLISGHTVLNGLLVLIGVLGGIVVFGLIGVVLGPVIIAIAAGLLHSYTRPGEVPGPPAGPASVTPG